MAARRGPLGPLTTGLLWTGKGEPKWSPSAPGPSGALMGAPGWGDMQWPAHGPSPSSSQPANRARTGRGRGTSPGRETGQAPQEFAKTAWWAIPGALVGLVLASVGAVIGQALSGEPQASLAQHPSALSELLSEAGLWAAMLGTALFVSRRYGSANMERDYGLAFKRQDIIWGMVAVGAGLAISGLVVAAFAHTSLEGTNDQILTQQKGNSVGFVTLSLIVSLGAPFFEELFFRGYLRTALQARFGKHPAVWLQAAFFGLAHLGESATTLGNVSVLLAVFGFGVVLGYAAQLTGRLGAGMVAHCLFNLVAVATVL